MGLASDFASRQQKKNSAPTKRELAAADFWEYEKIINPKFFKDSRPHLKEIAVTLQAVYEGRILKEDREDPRWKTMGTKEDADAFRKKHPEAVTCRKILLNIPPRHGKSYSVANFVDWVFGVDNTNRVIAVTYNETLASRFSVNVRDAIDATKLDDSITIFSDVFPDTKIKFGDSAKQIWSLEGQFFNYLATGFGGTITGIGCNIGIIDDPVKSSKEAYNDNLLNDQYSWYTDTFLSRVEEGGIQIIIQTRWSTKDLSGRLLSGPEGPEWYEFKMKACLDEEKGIMLCPELLSFESYKKKKALTSPAIMEANYQQTPVDVQGGLYTGFMTYEQLPVVVDGATGREVSALEQIKAYIDTADTGKDYLCGIIYGVYNLEAYVLEVIYTQESMESTEEEVAKALYFYNVTWADIESNNGGRGFARNVERILKEKYHTNRCIINWFHQSENKLSRIRSAATWVIRHLYYPINWMHRWPEYHLSMLTFQGKGSDEHDDAQDATTGVAEKTGYEADTWLY